MDTLTPISSSIVLVPGYWLGGWAWDAVAADLRGRGYHVVAVTLPGLNPDDPHRASTTVADQADALRLVIRRRWRGWPLCRPRRAQRRRLSRLGAP